MLTIMIQKQKNRGSFTLPIWGQNRDSLLIPRGSHSPLPCDQIPFPHPSPLRFDFFVPGRVSEVIRFFLGDLHAPPTNLLSNRRILKRAGVCMCVCMCVCVVCVCVCACAVVCVRNGEVSVILGVTRS